MACGGGGLTCTHIDHPCTSHCKLKRMNAAGIVRGKFISTPSPPPRLVDANLPVLDPCNKLLLCRLPAMTNIAFLARDSEINGKYQKS